MSFIKLNDIKKKYRMNKLFCIKEYACSYIEKNKQGKANE